MKVNGHKSILELELNAKNARKEIQPNIQSDIKIINRNKRVPAFKNNLYKPRDSSWTTEELNSDFLIVNHSSVNVKNNERSLTRDKNEVRLS